MLRVVFLLLLIMQGKLSYNVKRTLVTITRTETSTKPNNITQDFVKAINSTVSVTFSTKISSPSNTSKITRKGNLRKKSGQTKLNQKTVKKNRNVRKSLIPFTEAPLSILYLKNKSEPHVKKSITKENQVTNTTVKEYEQTKAKDTKPSYDDLKLSKQKLTSPRPVKPSFVYNSQIYQPVHEEDSELEMYTDPYYNEEIVPLRLTSDTLGNKRITYLSSKYGSDPDNPIFGDQAFFSFILNDYFDRNVEEEPKLMEDVQWGKDFDKELTDKRDAKRVRRLENYYVPVSSTETMKYDTTESKYIMEAEQIIKSLTSKPINTVTDHKEFKSIVDMFATKFGSNNKSNEPIFLRKREDRYRNDTIIEEKDELHEASELLLALVSNYNNENVEENENENFLTTLSEFEQFLNAHETQSVRKKDYKDPSNALSRLRHVAKNVALVNNADYVDTLENMLYKK